MLAGTADRDEIHCEQACGCGDGCAQGVCANVVLHIYRLFWPEEVRALSGGQGGHRVSPRPSDGDGFSGDGPEARPPESSQQLTRKAINGEGPSLATRALLVRQRGLEPPTV